MFIKSLKTVISCIITTALIASSGIANAGWHHGHPVNRVVVVKRVVYASRPAPLRCAIQPGHWSRGIWIAQHKNCWYR